MGGLKVLVDPSEWWYLQLLLKSKPQVSNSDPKHFGQRPIKEGLSNTTQNRDLYWTRRSPSPDRGERPVHPGVGEHQGPCKKKSKLDPAPSEANTTTGTDTPPNLRRLT